MQTENHSLEAFRKALSYDPITGVLKWKINNGRAFKGKIAGGVAAKGYLAFNFNEKTFKAHRVAWFMTYGSWPTHQIDHINGIKDDNRISNLREATQSENQKNVGTRKDNKTGYKGVSYHSKRKTYVARMMINGKEKWIGDFPTAEKASQEYLRHAELHHAEFAYHKRTSINK